MNDALLLVQREKMSLEVQELGITLRKLRCSVLLRVVRAWKLHTFKCRFVVLMSQ